MSIGDTIRYLRTRRGLSQAALGLAAGCSPSTVQRIEAGEIARPRRDTLEAFAKALGLSRAETARLLAGGGTPQRGETDPDGETVGALVLRHRRRRNLGRPALAARTGLDERTIRDIENGHRPRISLKTAEKLAGVLGLDERERHTLVAVGVDLRSTAGVSPTLGSLHGRKPDFVRIVDLLRDGGLVTVTGPGGVGKTALATVVADHTPGARRIRLADVPDGTDALLAVATDLNGDVPAADQVTPVLDGELPDTGLLVLDNLDQLADRAGAVHALLAVRPRLAILATSRTRLGMPGETVVELRPLDPAPALSVLRACLRRAGLREPAGTSAAHLRAICERVDRLPLTIEIVASWLGTMTPGEVRAALDDDLALLARPGGNGVSIAGSVRRSLTLLSDRARDVFSAMAVAAAPWTLDLLDAAARTDADQGELLEAVRELVRSGLVRLDRTSPASLFAMLQTVRDVGRLTLTELPDQGIGFRERHAERVLRLAEQHGPALLAGDASRAGEALDARQQHLPIAVEFYLSRGDPRALRLVGLLWRYWHIRGQYRFGLDLVRRARAAFPDPEPRDDAASAYGEAVLAYLAGEGQVWASALNALALYRSVGDPHGTGAVLSLLGMICHYEGRHDEARRWFETGLREVGPDAAPHAYANLLSNYAPALWELGDIDGAIAAAEQAAARFELLDDRRSVAAQHGNLAGWLFRRGDQDAGLVWLDRAARAFEQLDDQAGRAGVHLARADLALITGDGAAAAEALHEAEKLTVAREDPWQQALGAALTAELALLGGDNAEALRTARASAEAADGLEYKEARLRARCVLLYVHAIVGERTDALAAAREVLAGCAISDLPTLAGVAAIVAAISAGAPGAGQLRADVDQLARGRRDVPVAAARLVLARLDQPRLRATAARAVDVRAVRDRALALATG